MISEPVEQASTKVLDWDRVSLPRLPLRSGTDRLLSNEEAVVLEVFLEDIELRDDSVDDPRDTAVMEEEFDRYLEIRGDSDSDAFSRNWGSLAISSTAVEHDSRSCGC